MNGTFVPDRPGTYRSVVVMDDLEVATTSVSVHGDTDEDGGDSYFMYCTAGALLLLVIAILVAM